MRCARASCGQVRPGRELLYCSTQLPPGLGKMAQHYEVGTKAWQPDQAAGWIESEVEERLVDGERVKLVFRLADGEVSDALPSRAVRPY